jgi:hypothetical protein
MLFREIIAVYSANQRSLSWLALFYGQNTELIKVVWLYHIVRCRFHETLFIDKNTRLVFESSRVILFIS